MNARANLITAALTLALIGPAAAGASSRNIPGDASLPKKQPAVHLHTLKANTSTTGTGAYNAQAYVYGGASTEGRQGDHPREQAAVDAVTPSSTRSANGQACSRQSTSQITHELTPKPSHRRPAGQERTRSAPARRTSGADPCGRAERRCPTSYCRALTFAASAAWSSSR